MNPERVCCLPRARFFAARQLARDNGFAVRGLAGREA